MDAADQTVDTPPRRRFGRRGWVLVALIAALLVALLAVLLWPRPAEPVTHPTPKPTASASATPTPTSTAPAGFPANNIAYDTATLPQADVFAVIPALPVDPTPDAPFLGLTARVTGEAAPVWADPLGPPVAALPRDYTFDGTTVAVVERQQNWVRVLLTGRQALPSGGNAGQITGWLRAADVELAPAEAVVEVSLSARTIEIVRGGARETIATDFGSGMAESPTPVGRSFIMMTRAVPEFEYTRGHALVYLSVQSPTLDGFGGAEAAVTAFHYHDDRTGANSNGCLRVDEAAIAKLAELPQGTGVFIRP